MRDPRLLLVFEKKTNALVGLAAHERTTLQFREEPPFAATKLELVAVALSWQGKHFKGGTRVSDVVMAAVMRDVIDRVPRRDARVFAVVHEDNARSTALWSDRLHVPIHRRGLQVRLLRQRHEVGTERVS